MKTGICPKCGSTQVFKKEGGAYAGGPICLIKRVFFAKAIVLDAYLCTRCGHVEFSVPSHQLRETEAMTKTWSKVGPYALAPAEVE